MSNWGRSKDDDGNETLTISSMLGDYGRELTWTYREDLDQFQVTMYQYADHESRLPCGCKMHHDESNFYFLSGRELQILIEFLKQTRGEGFRHD